MTDTETVKVEPVKSPAYLLLYTGVSLDTRGKRSYRYVDVTDTANDGFALGVVDLQCYYFNSPLSLTRPGYVAEFHKAPSGKWLVQHVGKVEPWLHEADRVGWQAATYAAEVAFRQAREAKAGKYADTLLAVSRLRAAYARMPATDRPAFLGHVIAGITAAPVRKVEDKPKKKGAKS